MDKMGEFGDWVGLEPWTRSWWGGVDGGGVQT